MCGRFDIIEKPVKAFMDANFHLNFEVQTNHDVRPTQSVATLCQSNHQYQQLNAAWGIKPNWARKLLINAQSETVATKKTFARSFAQSRCLVPCTGWYEWCSNPAVKESHSTKTRYYFHKADDSPLLMAGILFQDVKESEQWQLVTLTTKPIEIASPYHHRMPLLVNEMEVDYWFNAKVEELQPLLENHQELPLVIEKSPY